ncbi:MAG TPA: hypothetical protein VE953_18230 [Terriglobales bacterium]|nr:hypothetical protein [Terriglobales bacterium]
MEGFYIVAALVLLAVGIPLMTWRPNRTETRRPLQAMVPFVGLTAALGGLLLIVLAIVLAAHR